MPAAVAIPLIAAGVGAGGSIAAAKIGSGAAKTAAQQQADSAQAGIAEQQREFDANKANQAPFVSAGQDSIASLMKALKDGTFGLGSNANAPTFTAPTAAEAAATPGYQFTRDQGTQAVNRGAAAAGGAFTGGTLKALDQYGSGLANSTYGDTFTRAMQGYQASLAGYQTNLSKQNQEFNQTSAIAGLGENAAANVGNTGTQVASTIGSLMTGIGNSQSAGTIGNANAISGGITGATNAISQGLLLNSLLQRSYAPQGPDNIGTELPTGSWSLPDLPATAFPGVPG